MNTDLLRRGKRVLDVVWLVLAASFALPPGGTVSVLRMAFVVMLAVHALEFLFFQRTLARLGGSMGRHFLMTLLYGFVHLQLARAECGEAAEAR